jgi:hypothetical protein
MIKIFCSCSVYENSSCIINKLISSRNSTRYWSSLEDLIHHIVFSRNISIFLNCVNFSSLLCPTSFSRHTIFAFNHTWTF